MQSSKINTTQLTEAMYLHTRLIRLRYGRSKKDLLSKFQLPKKARRRKSGANMSAMCSCFHKKSKKLLPKLSSQQNQLLSTSQSIRRILCPLISLNLTSRILFQTKKLRLILRSLANQLGGISPIFKLRLMLNQ